MLTSKFGIEILDILRQATADLVDPEGGAYD